ncbi:MAG: HNH endonuclease, partial [Acidimicrobiia bacterium]|nr:HNH endonuclease [Acidimicrobiia bacterium]
MKMTSWRVVAASATLVVGLGAVPAVGAESSVDLRVPSRGDVQSPSDTYQAIELLNTIRIERERPAGYRRSLFKHWLDIDGDGCDAREQVLKRDATGLPQVDPFNCFVVEADWVSPYDGKKTSDRSEVDIDHVVALKEAWDSGAWGWTESQRTAYANDTSDSRSLLAVSSSSNRSKSDNDPSNWLPPLKSYWCIYVSNWISVKARWSLSMDESEWGRLKNLLEGQCAGTTVRGFSAAPGGV